MAGTWPNLDAADLEARCRTYLNEATAGFYTQAEIWRWLSLAARNIAQSTLCVRRVLDKQTTSTVRTISHSAYSVLHVEYIPATGRRVMLERITPLQLGHYPLNGTAPQYFYEYGSVIGIDPLPDATYELRLYVADIPKMVIGAKITDFSTGFTLGTGWAGGSTATHTGAPSGDLTYGTALTASTNYTITLYVPSVGAGGSATPYIGTSVGTPITTKGYHTQTIVSSSPAPALKFSAVNSIELDDLVILKEADYASAGDQTELPYYFQGALALYATYHGLIKDRRLGAAQMLESIYGGELTYLKNQFVDVMPNGLNELRQG